MKSIAIIPARIGSKRIKQKNIKDFLGKPIIAYSISSAIESELFEEVIVSTDSQMIADIAQKYGASVPFLRDETLSDDYTDTLSVVSDAIKRLDNSSTNFDLVCCLYATAPLIQVDSLRKAENLCLKNLGKYVISVCKYSHPIDRSFKLDDTGKILLNNKEKIGLRTQDIEPDFHDAGQFYYGHKEHFLANSKLVSQNSIGLILENKYVCDIDDYEDWELAEFKFKALCR